MLRSKFNQAETFALAGLSLITALRLFALFLVIPSLSLYVSELNGSTPLLIGLAVGLYGLTQALLQLPLGFLSDILGRKPVIAAGLLIFAVGSLLAAKADSIEWFLLGRALQGGGAIAAAVMALLTDLIRESLRTKAIALQGMVIGVAFILAFALSPLLAHYCSVAGLFLLATALALLALVILFVLVPASPALPVVTAVSWRQLQRVLCKKELMLLNFSVFSLHALLALIFVAVPFVMEQTHSLAKIEQVWIYIPVVMLAFLCSIPALLLAERRGATKAVFLSAIALLIVATLLLTACSQFYWGLVLGLMAFFIAFTATEALLPSWLSKIAPPGYKGAAMGVFASSQFLGVFFGGLLAGWGLAHLGLSGVFLLALIWGVLWLLTVCSIVAPQPIQELTLTVKALSCNERAAFFSKLTNKKEVLEVKMQDEQLVIKILQKNIAGLLAEYKQVLAQ